MGVVWMGRKSTRPALTEEQRAEARRLLNDGLTFRQAAEKIGVAPESLLSIGFGMLGEEHTDKEVV